MARSDIQAGKAFVSLYLKRGDLEKGLLAASQRLKSWGQGLTSVGMKMLAGGSVITAALAATTAEFVEAGDAADHVDAAGLLNDPDVDALAVFADRHVVGMTAQRHLLDYFQRLRVDEVEDLDGLGGFGVRLLEVGLGEPVEIRAAVQDLRGGTPDESAVMMRDLLSNKLNGARRDAVLLNAAAALAAESGDYKSALEETQASLESGNALAKLSALVEYSQSFQTIQ